MFLATKIGLNRVKLTLIRSKVGDIGLELWPNHYLMRSIFSVSGKLHQDLFLFC